MELVHMNEVETGLMEVKVKIKYVVHICIMWILQYTHENCLAVAKYQWRLTKNIHVKPDLRNRLNGGQG